MHCGETTANKGKAVGEVTGLTTGVLIPHEIGLD
jgi:hypothetical protein